MATKHENHGRAPRQTSPFLGVDMLWMQCIPYYVVSLHNWGHAFIGFSIKYDSKYHHFGGIPFLQFCSTTQYLIHRKKVAIYKLIQEQQKNTPQVEHASQKKWWLLSSESLISGCHFRFFPKHLRHYPANKIANPSSNPGQPPRPWRRTHKRCSLQSPPPRAIQAWVPQRKRIIFRDAK